MKKFIVNSNSDLNSELNDIDGELERINQQIEYLQYEKEGLLKRRNECKQKLKNLSTKPSLENNEASTNSVNWKATSLFLSFFVKKSPHMQVF